jgi:hypothetical protein
LFSDDLVNKERIIFESKKEIKNKKVTKMNNCNQDMDVIEFARKICMLSIDTPLANKYDEEYGQRTGRWWSCQREHLTVWALHYPTKGKDNFTHEPSNSSKKMYNHFGRPETLLWLAEALGVDSKLIEEVIGEISNHSNASTRCKIIREYIPFERILELLD